MPPRVCRVSLYIDGNSTDMALPGDVPVEVLIPALHDALIHHGLPPRTVLVARGLAAPGRAPLDPTKTLRENGITDGAVLTLAAAALPGSAPAVIDAGAAVAAAPRAPDWLRQPNVARVAGLAVAITMAGLTGLLMVPGGPALPDALLAAAAASVVAVVSARLAKDAGHSVGPPSAVACLGLLCTVAALAGILCGLSAEQAGIALTVLSTALLTVSNRICVRVCGLSPALGDNPERDPAPRVSGARSLLGGLIAGAAGGAALGVLAACASGSEWPRSALAGAVAVMLLLRIRHHPEPLPSATLLTAGILSAATALVTVHHQLPASTWPLCLTTLLLGAIAIWLGVNPPEPTWSAGAARLMTAVEQLLPAAVIPLACWACGAFGAVRGLALS